MKIDLRTSETFRIARHDCMCKETTQRIASQVSHFRTVFLPRLFGPPLKKMLLFLLAWTNFVFEKIYNLEFEVKFYVLN